MARLNDRQMDYQSDKLSERVIGCVIEVHKVLGPGFLESIYRNALLKELTLRGLHAEVEKEYRVNYKGEIVGIHRMDLIVEQHVIIEAKTVQDFAPEHFDQLRSYLKATGMRVGLLVNFAKSMAEFKRVEL